MKKKVHQFLSKGFDISYSTARALTEVPAILSDTTVRRPETLIEIRKMPYFWEEDKKTYTLEVFQRFY